MITNIIIILELLFIILYNLGVIKPFYGVEEVVEETKEEEPDVVYFQQQMYNVEKYRERMAKMKEEAKEDEDGLYDVASSITLEQLGYYTGTEASDE